MYRLLNLVSVLVVAGVFPSTSRADVTLGEASAFGLFVNTDIVDQNNLLNVLVSADLGPTPSVSDIAPAPFNLSASLASASVSAGSLTTLGGGTIVVNAATVDTSDTLDVTASSNVDGLPGSRNADATASVENLSIDVNPVSVFSLLNTANVFSFDASLITSEAHASGDFGALVATGNSVIIDANGVGDGFLTFSVLGVNLDVAVDAMGQVAPNTTLNITSALNALLGDSLGTDLNGQITVILNEQIPTGDGITSAGITVNAIHVLFVNTGAEFFNALGISIGDTNFVTGEIIVAQSHALLNAVVPEPSSLALLGLACTAVFARRRCRSAG
ncbi:MAG: PEP-CTERM sorting domain-containing protein [Pirellulales bacterium]|nr:PEP-CTERM sorting domain-containing protein [Pirellulales bacterium]